MPAVRCVRCFAAVLLVAASARPAGAVDGVIEINQTRALAGGVTSGDAAGFPVTIDTPGSYRLTGNLTVANADVDAIRVTASGVTLDLNGWSIVGPTTCTGTPPNQAVTCAPENGDAAGIDAAGAAHLTVRGGTIRGMPWSGVACGTDCHLLDVRAVVNGRFGARVGSRSRVETSIFDRNGDWGLLGTSDVVEFVHSIAMFNGDGGLSLLEHNLVRESLVNSNGGTGISAVSAHLEGNSVTYNGGNGIQVNSGVVRDNAAQHNEVWGINLSGATSALGGNAVLVSAASGAGAVAGTYVELAGNLCDDVLCP